MNLETAKDIVIETNTELGKGIFKLTSAVKEFKKDIYSKDSTLQSSIDSIEKAIVKIHEAELLLTTEVTKFLN